MSLLVGPKARIRLLSEGLLVFTVVHLLYRLFRLKTEWGATEARLGLNLSLAILFVAATCLAVALSKRSRAEFGLQCSWRSWREAVVLGTSCLLLALLVGTLTLPLGVRTGSRMTWSDSSVVLVLGLLTTVVFFALLQRFERRSAGHRSLVALSAVALLLLVTAPLLELFRGGAAGPVIKEVVSRGLIAALAEEIFFRGYLQSRWNLAFGRPWRLFGVQFGMGLILSTLLFGFVHALNSYDYFSGNGQLAWGAVIAALAMPYGFLRERTGGVWAPFVLHGLYNCAGVLARGLGPHT